MSARLTAFASTVAFALCSVCPAALAQGAFTQTELADFEEPWAMAFLPDGRLLVSEKAGALKLYNPDGGATGEVTGVPEVAYQGQGGFGDVVLHPDFAENNLVYLSYAEAGEGDTRGAAVARARLALSGDGGALEDLEVIWRQDPKVEGAGHYGHRIAFGEGYLWISSGERQAFDPAQDMSGNLGKVIRLNEDGSVPADNPFADQGGATAQIWTLGHRNPLGLSFDSEGRLWDVEMGPAGGDELNLVVRGSNYGWPTVSNGSHYDGRDIPDHSAGDDFSPPAVFWNPSISPSSLLFYSGSEFPEWQGDAFIGGLSSQAIIRVEFDGETAREAERIDMGTRIRAIEQGPDGALWVLEDESARSGGEGRLLRLGAPG